MSRSTILRLPLVLAYSRGVSIGKHLEPTLSFAIREGSILYPIVQLGQYARQGLILQLFPAIKKKRF
jgi:hypothetical protein